MADNTTLNAGSGGDVIATDDISSVKYQIVKLAFGALNTANIVTSASTNPLPCILGANSGVDIGDVDILSIIPGTGATNLGKAIDSAVGGTDTGIEVISALYGF